MGVFLWQADGRRTLSSRAPQAEGGFGRQNGGSTTHGGEALSAQDTGRLSRSRRRAQPRYRLRLPRKEQFEWLDGAQRAVKRLNDRGYLVIVVTNQAGIARGLYRLEDVEIPHAWVNAQLAAKGAHLDAFYFCPHHPETGSDPHRMVCDCRKPAPGMLLQAIRE